MTRETEDMASVKLNEGGGPVNAPRFSVNAFQVVASATEVSLLCLSQVIGLSKDGKFEAGAVPAVQLGFSPAVAKELLVLLGGIVAKHEEEMGEIQTPYLRKSTLKK